MVNSQTLSSMSVRNFYDRISELLSNHGSFTAYGPMAYRFSLHDSEYANLAALQDRVLSMPQDIILHAGQTAASMVREINIMHEALLLYHEATILLVARHAIEQADNTGSKVIHMPPENSLERSLAVRVGVRLHKAGSVEPKNEMLIRVAVLFMSPPLCSEYSAKAYAKRGDAFLKLENREKITGHLHSEEELISDIYSLVEARNVPEIKPQDIMDKFRTLETTRLSFPSAESLVCHQVA